MSTRAGISSNITKKIFPLYHYTTSSISTINLPLSQTTKTPFQLAKPNWTNVSPRDIYQRAQYYSLSIMDLPGNYPPEFPQASPPERYNVPLEVPQIPDVPDFDPIIPPEKPADPPPLSPEENPCPGFPGPPSPSPLKPEAPVPPLSPPEVAPPHGPEIMPSPPPDPGPPHPTQPDIPTPIRCDHVN